VPAEWRGTGTRNIAAMVGAASTSLYWWPSAQTPMLPSWLRVRVGGRVKG
jgi:hypothetical protein